MDMQMLQQAALFSAMTRSEVEEALRVLGARVRQYARGAIVLSAGAPTDSMGLVLSGSATVESNDVWGNRTIFARVGPGQLFAESYALLPGEPMLVDVAANEDCRILFLKMEHLASLLSRYAWAPRLMAELLKISARKNLHLAERSFHTSPKTVRGRLLAYLNSVALREGRREFDIPFDRQQLADYLNLDRTALSKELGKMQREGFFIVRKNHFALSHEL